VPVHLENVACAMDELVAMARGAGVAVLEDAAQSIGVTYKGRAVGTIGDMGAFSFQETKNIATGEGGLVCSDDEELYVRAARFHDQGGQFVTQYRGSRGPERGESFIGDNLRMTEVAGALGLVQLRRLAPLLDAMRANCRRARDAIGAVGGLQPRRRCRRVEPHVVRSGGRRRAPLRRRVARRGHPGRADVRGRTRIRERGAARPTQREHARRAVALRRTPDDRRLRTRVLPAH
jgi:dTDP-4-amino-4,6-dideoxygalactose transaminase